MTTCGLCGMTYEFDSNVRHVCVGGGWQLVWASAANPLPMSTSGPAPSTTESARRPAEAQGPLESEPAGRHRVWSGLLSADLHGTLCIQYDDLPGERQAMRRLLHERLQAFGDDLMAEWERARTQEIHAAPKEKEA